MICQAITKKGKPCSYKAKFESNYCGCHENYKYKVKNQVSRITQRISTQQAAGICDYIQKKLDIN